MFRRIMLTLLVLVAFFTTLPVSANTLLDASVYFKATHQGDLEQTQATIPWATYAGNDNLFFDCRYNFDAKNAASAFIGRVYTLTSDGTVQITPELGVIAGKEYIGLSPEFYIWGQTGRVSYITLNQYAAGASGWSPNFFYHWAELRYVVVDKQLELGLTWQGYVEPASGTGMSFDGGPLVKVMSGPAYVKVTYNMSATETNPARLDKWFLGIGWQIKS